MSPRQDPRDFWKSVHTIEKAESETGGRLIRGLVTVGSVDADGEVVDQRSAFVKLSEWLDRGGTPVTWMHDLGGSLGRALEVEPMVRNTASSGPKFVPTSASADVIDAVSVTTQIGRGYGFGTTFFGRVEVDDVWAMLDQQAVNKQSIGFRGYEAGEHESGAPLVMVQQAMEYAVVTVPAQKEAEVTVQRMAKHFGIHTQCKACEERAAAELSKLRNLDRKQWGTVVAHLREHGQDEGDEMLRVLARGLVELGAAFSSGKG